MEIFNVVVPKLEDLARDAGYRSIIDNLSLCYGHGPNGSRPYLRCSQSDDIQDQVWSLLNDQSRTLLGLMSDKVRTDYAERYYQSLKNQRADFNIVVDPWLFLDSVLDDSFKELNLHVALPGKEASYWLMRIITDRSPLLTKLTIDFSLMKRADDSSESERKVEAVIRSLARLHHLTDLHLMGMKNGEALVILSLIGDVCPSLSSLRVSDYLDRGNDIRVGDDKFILALIMGKFAGMFDCEDRPIWCEIDELERIDVPAEFCTPICYSLRILQISFCGSHSPMGTAFALRNIPRLQKWNGLESVSDGIEMLHRGQHGNNPFQGPLSLTAVDRVNVKSRKCLKAVGDLCPSLEKAEFMDWFDDVVEPADFVSPNELAVILSKWPKPTTIELYEVAHLYTKSILEVFGPELKHLEIDCCSSADDGTRIVVKVAHFALCPKLESLAIENFIMEETENVSSLDATTFLPHLKSLRTDGCMGRFSRFFEEKSSLVDLDIYCSHIRIDIAGNLPRNGRQSLKEFQELQMEKELKRIHELWSQLESLAIRQFAGLSMDMMERLVPRLRKLKKVVLPQTIPSCDVLLYNSLKNELGTRKTPGVISLEEFYDFVVEDDFDCLILNV